MTTCDILLFLSLYLLVKSDKSGCLKNHLIKEMERNLADLKAMKVQCTDSEGGATSGGTYTRWGKSSCPKHASLVYEGYAAGKHYNKGGSGSNFLCLPKNPEWKEYSDGIQSHRGYIYGVEYEIIQEKPFDKKFNNKNTPCAVCQSTRSNVLMIPGKTRCTSGWRKEFSGYLMSEMSTKGRTPSSYICVDEKLDAVPGGDGSTDEAVLYSVESHCGTLKCPPYVSGRELTCVVCSK